jgi:hypothetical protein
MNERDKILELLKRWDDKKISLMNRVKTHANCSNWHEADTCHNQAITIVNMSEELANRFGIDKSEYEYRGGNNEEKRTS